MVLSDYAKQRILSLHWRGLKVSSIVEYLVLEDRFLHKVFVNVSNAINITGLLLENLVLEYHRSCHLLFSN